MRDYESKTAWEARNVCKVVCKINRNQDPDLYDALASAPSKSALARELMRAGLDAARRNKQE